jgi:hypothetical protein
MSTMRLILMGCGSRFQSDIVRGKMIPVSVVLQGGIMHDEECRKDTYIYIVST